MDSVRPHTTPTAGRNGAHHRRRTRDLPRRVLLVLAVALVGGLLSVPAAQASTTSWNAWSSGSISSSRPTGSYAFSLKTAATARFVLGDLGADYALTLQNSSHRTVATSNRSGVKSEEIVRTLAAGTYYAVVSSPGKRYTSKAFSLQGRLLSGVSVLSRSARILPDGRFLLAVDLFNTTSTPKNWAADVKFYDANGGYLETRSLSVWGGAVLPHSHGIAGTGLVNWYFTALPSGWKSYRILNVRSWQMVCNSWANMPISKFTATTDPSNSALTRWSGLVANAAASRRSNTAQIAVATLDSRANILTATGGYSNDVPSGEAISWAHSDYRVGGVNRVIATAQAYAYGCSST